MSLHVPVQSPAVDPKTGKVHDRWMECHQRVGESYGTWYPVAYLAANFSWTVQEADQITYAYSHMGQRLEVALVLRTTASGAVANGTVALPAGLVAARDMSTLVEINDNGTTQVGRAKVAAGGTVITITRVDGAAFTDLRAVEGVFAMEVQN